MAQYPNAGFCSRCGAPRVPGAAFCGGCGFAFNQAQFNQPPALPGQMVMHPGGGPGGPPPGQPAKYGTPMGPNGMPMPVTLLPTQALQLPAKLNRCYLGLGWESFRGSEMDLDASAALFSDCNCVDMVSFQQLRDRFGVKGQSTTVHTGDILSDSGQMKNSPSPNRDLERIYFDLFAMPSHITSITLLINVYTPGATFANLQRATCRVVNADSEQELGRFELQNLKGNGLVFGQLVRARIGLKEWRFVALGMARPGRTANELVQSLIQQAQHPPHPPAYKPQQHQQQQQPTVTQKPTASRTSPGMVAATAAGVAAGAAIFTVVALETGMLGGEGGGMMGMANLGDISMPDMPDMNVDLAPVGEAMSNMGDMAGDAVNSAGEAVGDLGSSLQSGFNDMGGFGGIGSAMGDAVGNGAEAVGNFAGGAAEWAGGAAGDVGDFAGDAANWAGGAAGDVGQAIGGAAENIPTDEIGDACSSLLSCLGGGDEN